MRILRIVLYLHHFNIARFPGFPLLDRRTHDWLPPDIPGKTRGQHTYNTSEIRKHTERGFLLIGISGGEASTRKLYVVDLRPSFAGYVVLFKTFALQNLVDVTDPLSI